MAASDGPITITPHEAALMLESAEWPEGIDRAQYMMAQSMLLHAMTRLRDNKGERFARRGAGGLRRGAPQPATAGKGDAREHGNGKRQAARAAQAGRAADGRRAPVGVVLGRMAYQRPFPRCYNHDDENSLSHGKICQHNSV